MDLSNIITATNFTTDKDGLLYPAINKLTTMGYSLKSYSPSSDIINGLFSAIRKLGDSWLGILISILLVIFIGEIIFYYRIKKDKVKYNDNKNSFILKNKVLSYFISFFIIIGCTLLVPGLLLLIIVIILNIHIMLFVIIVSLLYGGVLLSILILLLKTLVYINKKMFGYLIKQETLEEYEARQSTYMFRDGTIVKVKPNIVEDMIIDNHRVTHRLEKQSKNGKVYVICGHDSKGKAKIKTFDDNETCPTRWECFLDMASLDDVLKFKKDKDGYDKKQEIKKQSKLYKFCDWCISFK